MREIIVSEFVTLDGVMEDPGGAEKTERGGWGIHSRNTISLMSIGSWPMRLCGKWKTTF